MKPLFDEREADHEVIRSLLKALNRRYEMSKLMQDAEGLLYKALSFEKLAKEEAEQLLSDLKSDVATLEAYLVRLASPASSPADQPNNGGDNGQANTAAVDQS